MIDIDQSAPIVEPPTEVEELYSHLQTREYRHLLRRDIILGKELGAG